MKGTCSILAASTLLGAIGSMRPGVSSTQYGLARAHATGAAQHYTTAVLADGIDSNTRNFFVNTLDDFRGSALATGDNTTITVVDVEWGINRFHELVPVYLRFLDKNGTVREADDRVNAAYIYTDLAEVHWFYLLFPQHDGTVRRIWTESVRFAVVNGKITTVGFSGTDEQGAAVEMVPPISLAPVPACAWTDPTYSCVPNQCAPPAECPVEPPCTCSNPSGNCDPVLIQRCPHDGMCPVEEKCQPRGVICDCF